MLTIYISIAIMLLIALSLLAFSYKMSYGKFFLYALIFCVLSLTLYQFSGNKIALKNWLTHGQEHYVLMEQFQELGGLDGMIARVKQRLAENPNDPQGKLILQKLYDAKANEHFERRTQQSAAIFPQ